MEQIKDNERKINTFRNTFFSLATTYGRGNRRKLEYLYYLPAESYPGFFRRGGRGGFKKLGGQERTLENTSKFVYIHFCYVFM